MGHEEVNVTVTLSKSGDKVQAVCQNAAMDDLALMLGVFAGLVVTEAVKRGMTIDDVKDAMLDIFLASTAQLDERTAEEIINGNTVL